MPAVNRLPAAAGSPPAGRCGLVPSRTIAAEMAYVTASTARAMCGPPRNATITPPVVNPASWEAKSVTLMMLIPTANRSPVRIAGTAAIRRMRNSGTPSTSRKQARSGTAGLSIRTSCPFQGEHWLELLEVTVTAHLITP
jgi:hypothetical protein